MALQFRLYRKAGDNDPPKWRPVDAHTRKLSLRAMSDTAVLQNMTRGYDPTPTHVMRGDYDEEYTADRLLKCLSDDSHWMIVAVQQVGRRRRGSSHTGEVKLRVAPHNLGDDL
jgi:hypothetical protein